MILEAITAILNPAVLPFKLIGVVVGALIGALPGLSVVMAISILTPITFGLEPAQGLAMLMGVYNAGGMGRRYFCNSGKYARNSGIHYDHSGWLQYDETGRSRTALGINVIYSAFGGLISSVVLMFAAFPIAKFALKFGPAEYFALSLFGLSMIIGISRKVHLKGNYDGLCWIPYGNSRT